MRTIDSHQHFWSYDPNQYPWIQAESPIQRSFLPQDLEPLLRETRIDGCVAVQARQTVEETRWLLELARQYPFIAGVVGWVDLRSPEVAAQIDQFHADEKLVGIRHVVQDEPDDRFILREAFCRGISALKEFDLAYDLLIFPNQLPAAIELVRRFPEQRFVLDHLAKPQIKQQQMEPWRGRIRELAQAPNVFCKISGMVTEARWGGWQPSDFQPYLDEVWNSFGADRLMIGSDWPVCLLSADYQRTMGIVHSFLQQFAEEEREKVLGANAIRFYRLPV